MPSVNNVVFCSRECSSGVVLHSTSAWWWWCSRCNWWLAHWPLPSEVKCPRPSSTNSLLASAGPTMRATTMLSPSLGITFRLSSRYCIQFKLCSTNLIILFSHSFQSRIVQVHSTRGRRLTLIGQVILVGLYICLLYLLCMIYAIFSHDIPCHLLAVLWCRRSQ